MISAKQFKSFIWSQRRYVYFKRTKVCILNIGHTWCSFRPYCTMPYKEFEKRGGMRGNGKKEEM